jgi:hypothetical protein
MGHRPVSRPSSIGTWAPRAIPKSIRPGRSKAGLKTRPKAGGEGIYVDLKGMPGRTELLAYYAERSGRQVDDFDYYIVLARWKLAIVLERGFQRVAGDPKLESFGTQTLDLIARAAKLATSSSYRGTVDSAVTEYMGG